MSDIRVIKRQKKGEKKFDASMRIEDVEKLLLTRPLKQFNQEASEKGADLTTLLLTESRIARYSEGEIIFAHTDYGDSCFVLLTGEVDAYKAKQPSQLLQASKVTKKSIFEAAKQLFDSHSTYEKRHVATYMSKKDLAYDAANTSIIASDNSNNSFTDEFDQYHRYKAGDLIGHVSAYARTPRYETVVAKGQVELLELKWQALRELKRFSATLNDLVQSDYKAHGLENFLATIPDLSQLPRETIENICSQATTESFGSADWNIKLKKLRAEAQDSLNIQPLAIAKKGDYAEDIFIVRSGFVVIDDGQNQHYKTSGEVIGLNQDYLHSSTMTFDISALLFAEVLRIPKQLLASTLSDKDNKQAAKKSESLYIDSISQLFGENLFVNGRKSMLINLDRCTECDDCVTACANAHGGNPRFVRQGPAVAQFMVANACMHCKDPVCTIGCPTGAIKRNSHDGSVIINDQTCIGCATCANSCPYDNIKMTSIVDEAGRIVVDEEHKPIIKATKCDLCYNQKTTPACEYACPNDALKRVDIEHPDKKLKAWLQK